MNTDHSPFDDVPTITTEGASLDPLGNRAGLLGPDKGALKAQLVNDHLADLKAQGYEITFLDDVRDEAGGTQ